MSHQFSAGPNSQPIPPYQQTAPMHAIPAGYRDVGPDNAFRNRLLFVIAGLGALTILGCVGVIALGLVVGPQQSNEQPVAVSATQPAAVPTTQQGGAEGQPTSQAPAPASTAPSHAVSSSAATTAAPQHAGSIMLPPVQSVAEAVLPNLVGQNAAVAGDALTKLGFTNIDYGSQDEYDTVVIIRSNWTVTRQSTPAGVKTPLDTLIVLTCTKKH